MENMYNFLYMHIYMMYRMGVILIKFVTLAIACSIHAISKSSFCCFWNYVPIVEISSYCTVNERSSMI